MLNTPWPAMQSCAGVGWRGSTHMYAADVDCEQTQRADLLHKPVNRMTYLIPHHGGCCVFCDISVFPPDSAARRLGRPVLLSQPAVASAGCFHRAVHRSGRQCDPLALPPAVAPQASVAGVVLAGGAALPAVAVLLWWPPRAALQAAGWLRSQNRASRRQHGRQQPGAGHAYG